MIIAYRSYKNECQVTPLLPPHLLSPPLKFHTISFSDAI